MKSKVRSKEQGKRKFPAWGRATLEPKIAGFLLLSRTTSRIKVCQAVLLQTSMRYSGLQKNFSFRNPLVAPTLWFSVLRVSFFPLLSKSEDTGRYKKIKEILTTFCLTFYPWHRVEGPLALFLRNWKFKATDWVFCKLRYWVCTGKIVELLQSAAPRISPGN